MAKLGNAPLTVTMPRSSTWRRLWTPLAAQVQVSPVFPMTNCGCAFGSCRPAWRGIIWPANGWRVSVGLTVILTAPVVVDGCLGFGAGF